MTDIRQALESIDLLANLPAAALDQLARFTTIRMMRKGETVFCQGEPSPYCFGIVSGEVLIQRMSSDKRFPPKVLGELTAGALFGESAFFEDSPRLAQANAKADGELIMILGSKLREWLRGEPEAGVPLTMGLLRNSIERLHHTSHELSIVYGTGRLLGSVKGFRDRVGEAASFLRSSILGVDGIILYRKNPYWDEFEAVCYVPDGKEPSAIPLEHGLLKEAAQSTGAEALESPDSRQLLASLELPWALPASAAIVPLVDRDKEGHPLQGLLLVANQKDVDYFNSSRLLLLSAIADPFSETLSRHRREEDLAAQGRLAQGRQGNPL